MLTTYEERKTLTEFLMRIGSAAAAVMYAQLSGQAAAWTVAQPSNVAAVAVIDYLGNEPLLWIGACDWLVLSYPADPLLPRIAAMVVRLREQQALQEADPIEETWIGAEPMVNRATLRGLLRDLASNFDHPVIYIAGNTASGRSHSAKLIRHVAERRNQPYGIVDFKVPVDERTLSQRFDRLCQAFGILPPAAPTSLGATPGDVALKFCSRLREVLQGEPPGGPRRWVVIDFSEEVPDGAVAEFISQLCAHRADADFVNCVIFVLGPLDHLAKMRDLPNLQPEELGPVLQTDVLHVAQVVNKRGKAALSDAAIAHRAVAIFNEVEARQEHEKYPELRKLLAKLRNEVRAP